MAIESRIRELGSRHENLDRSIQEETKRPASDATRLRELKRRKLRLKEEIEGLRSQLH
ncbi:YdcH family protein [Caulobacter sp.]|uniref:YdcH family protein n=1 Tax=Caulobacter sp. TaxID=78 RepID=UPI003BACE275